MKKRAVISTAASIMLAGAMCFGFAACGEGETDVRKKIDALRGEEVTEEVWNAVWNTTIPDTQQRYNIFMPIIKIIRHSIMCLSLATPQ